MYFYKHGTLHLGTHTHSVEVKNFVADHPVYLYDREHIRERIELYKRESPLKATLHFAMKSNSNLEVLKLMASEGIGVDVVSGGEIKRALDAGIRADQIIYSGVGKSKTEITYAINSQIGQVNVESFPELMRIVKIAESLQKPIGVALRFNPSIDVHTHEKIATGSADDKFGILEEDFKTVLTFLKENQRWVTLVGLSVHIGSMITEIEDYRQSYEKLVAIYRTVKNDGFDSLVRLDLGGGVGIYYEETNFHKEELLLKNYMKLVKEIIPSDVERIQFEPGRFLVAHAGVLLAEIEYIKETPHRTFMILNTGMHHLIRPALYGAKHRIFPLNQSSDSLKKYDVVGPICESSDVFGEELMLSPQKEGDFVAILDAGAYGFTMSSDYNLHHKPIEKMV